MNPPPLSGPRRSSARRPPTVALVILLLVLLPILVIVIWSVSYRIGNTNAIRRLEAEAKQRGEPLTLADLAAKYPPIPDAENVAVPLLALWEQEDPVFWRAFLDGRQPLPKRISPGFDPFLPILGSKSPRPSRTEPYPPASLAAAESHLKSRAAHRKAVRDALLRPRFRVPIKITDSFDTLPPHLALMKAEAQDFRLEALVATEGGDVDAAVAALAITASIGHLLTNEPLVMDDLIRVACSSMVLDAAERLLSRQELTPAQLARLNNIVDQLKAPGRLRSAFLSERAVCLRVFDLPMDGASRMISPDGEEGGNQAELRVGLGFMTAIGLAQADRRLMLETFDTAIHLSENDAPEAIALCEQTFSQAYKKAVRFPPRIFTALLLGAEEKIATKFTSLEARRRAALTAIAVQNFRLEKNGALPQRLEDLVPRFLPAVPRDPFDGQPLRYRRLPAGFVVYSIGADRQDNNGRERPRKGPVTDFDQTFIIER